MKPWSDPSEFFKLIRRFDPNPWLIRTSNENPQNGIAFQIMNNHEDRFSEHTVHEKISQRENRGFVYKFIKVLKYILQMTRAAYL